MDREIGESSIFQWIELEVYNFEGRLVKEIGTPLPRSQRITRRDLDEWRERLRERITDKFWYNRFGRVIEKYKKSIYEKMPNIAGVSLTPDGNIFISSLSGFWLLDEGGKEIAHVSANAYGVKISPHFLFFGQMDEMGSIFIPCLKREGSEQEDLLRISR